jgi:hypothetical protein
MKFIEVASSALMASVLFLSGCSVGASDGNSSSGPDLTGNWQFIGIDDFFHAVKVGGLAGSLVSQGNSITGVLHGTGCVAATQDIAFSGTEDAKGNVTLTSTNLQDNIATISGTASITPGGIFFQSTLQITGSGPCAMSQPYPVFTGRQYPPLNGNFGATLTSSSSATVTLTASLTAAATNADGEIPETGTLTLAAANCSSTYSFTGFALGASLEGTLAGSSGSITVPAFSGHLSGLEPSAVVTLTSPTGSCAAGSFTGTLMAK